MIQQTIPSENRPQPRLGLQPAVGALLLFAAFLASTPARNLDLWNHLADGRDLLLLRIAPSATWLYDIAAYLFWSVGSGTALLAAKSAAFVFTGWLLLKSSRCESRSFLPYFIVGWSLLAAAHRLPLQPTIVSLLVLALAMKLASDRIELEPARLWPGWKLFVLFAIWANVHDWAILGAILVSLVALGNAIDSRGSMARPLVWFASLAFASLLTPSPFAIVSGFDLSGQSSRSGDAGLIGFAQSLHSPFSRSYWTLFQEVPAALAYYPLLALGLLSFPLNRRGWRWSRFLPFAAAALASAWEARTIPLFAIVAAPILSRNLGEFFSRSAVPARERIGPVVAAIPAIAFLIAAWPGWLQSPPYEPRRWAVEIPADLERGAAFVRSIPAGEAGTRTLHLTRGSYSAFRWYCLEDAGLVDDRLIASLVDPTAAKEAAARFAEANVHRIVVRAGDPICDLHLARLLADPMEWPLVGLDGGVAVFHRRSAGRTIEPVDLDRIAYRPTEAERAPLETAVEPFVEPWLRPYWRPSYPRSAARDEARLHLAIVDSLGRDAPFLHMVAWESSQLAGLIGAANPLVGIHAVDADIRLNLFQPPLPESDPFAKAQVTPLGRVAFAYQQRFAQDRGQATPGRVHSAIRAARRAVAENPTDATAQVLLAKAYLALPQQTGEQKWGTRFTPIARLRNIQASAAFNRALALNPDLAEAHFDLASLYQGAGCLDLALGHLKEWRKLESRRTKAGGDRTRLEAMDPIIERIEKDVNRNLAEFEKEASRIAVADRATVAVRRGLGGTARDLLLKSDVSAFGRQGTEIELDFLLRTGRPRDVLDWLTPEVEGTVGAWPFHWMRTQAHAALGNYAAARDELAAVIGANGQLATPKSVRDRVCELIGPAILDEQPNRTQLPQMLLHGLRHSDFLGHMLELEGTLGQQCDAAVLDGLLAMEAGFLDEAKARFRSVVALAPRRSEAGQLNRPSIEVARDALQLIEQFDGK